MGWNVVCFMPKGKNPTNALNAKRFAKHSEPRRYGDGNGLYFKLDKPGARRWVPRTMVNGRRRDMGLGGQQAVSLAKHLDPVKGGRSYLGPRITA